MVSLSAFNVMRWEDLQVARQRDQSSCFQRTFNIVMIVSRQAILHVLIRNMVRQVVAFLLPISLPK